MPRFADDITLTTTSLETAGDSATIAGRTPPQSAEQINDDLSSGAAVTRRPSFNLKFLPVTPKASEPGGGSGGGAELDRDNQATDPVGSSDQPAPSRPKEDPTSHLHAVRAGASRKKLPCLNLVAEAYLVIF